MEILGGGPDGEEALSRSRRRQGRSPEGPATTGDVWRRPVAAALDLGTTTPPDEASAWASLHPPVPAEEVAPADIEERTAETSDGAGAPGRDGPPMTDSAAAASPSAVRDPRVPLGTALFGAPSLALAALAVTVAALSGGGPMVLLYAELPQEPATSSASVLAKALAAIGVVSGVLAVAALRRMRADSPRWVPAVAGAALLIALLVLAVAGFFWWTASDPTLPEPVLD